MLNVISILIRAGNNRVCIRGQVISFPALVIKICREVKHLTPDLIISLVHEHYRQSLYSLVIGIASSLNNSGNLCCHMIQLPSSSVIKTNP